MTITSEELREKHVDFFKKNNHVEIGNASLIPENDPTVLFTTAGMQQLVPFFDGEPHPNGKRLVNNQKCIRTGDIDDVGDQWHLSLFEMLGNWSLGDYFKGEAIKLSFEFVTEILGISKDKLSASVFEGDKDAPRDEEAAKFWEKVGVPKERIYFLPKGENWWGPAGETGPCGPNSEMFFLISGGHAKDAKEFMERGEKGEICEIRNDVFLAYNKNKEGAFEKLSQNNVDNGMGLERTIAVLNGLDNVYETDLLKTIFEKVKELSNVGFNIDTNIKSARIITDHVRAATFLLGDPKGIVPSNVDQGYVLRKFIRRAIRHARLLGIQGSFCKQISEKVIERMNTHYPNLEKNKGLIFAELEKEEEKFSIALENGTKKLEKTLGFLVSAGKKELSAKGAFDLYQSNGFPIEMTREMCSEKGFAVDEKGFEELLKGHQELSRKGAEQKFKGGLADNKEETTKLHTAAHLTIAAMKEIINPDTEQKGANINAERLRFDFNSDERLTDEQLRAIEAWVNEAIASEATVIMEVLTLADAKKSGAHGVFDSKYGDNVKVYTITGADGKIYSKEICGGPHVETLAGMGTYKIIKQEAVAAGIKRIKAVLE
jgi:alanyl-tRNA synthetase